VKPIKLELVPIESDDDLDPSWVSLPDQQKWDLVREFMGRGLRFEQRFSNPNISLKVIRTQNVFAGLPRSAKIAQVKLTRANPEPAHHER
jgi:hypothetical protein